MLLVSSCTRHLIHSTPARHYRLQPLICQSVGLQTKPEHLAVHPASDGPKVGGGWTDRMASDAPAPTPFLIGVAGGTASGKTSVCRKIMAQLNKDVPVSCHYRLSAIVVFHKPRQAAGTPQADQAHGAVAGPPCAESEQQHCRRNKVSSIYHKTAFTAT